MRFISQGSPCLLINQKEQYKLQNNNNQKEIIEIPLNNSPEPALIDREGLERVKAAGFPGAWFMAGDGRGYNYVTTTKAGMVGSNFTVSRIAAGALPGQIVKYRNGNRHDLRATNLYIVKGASKARQAKAAIETNTPERVQAQRWTRESMRRASPLPHAEGGHA